MDLTQLKTFVTVAESGSFSTAAKELHMANSTVTGHIQRLERELDCRLLARNTHSMTLTDAGSTLYVHARQMLGTQANLINILKKSTQGCTISIAALPKIQTGLLSCLLTKYCKKGTVVTFDLHEGTNQEILSQLRCGSISIGFVDEECPDNDITCIPLGKSEKYLVIPNIPRFNPIQEKTLRMSQVFQEYPYIMPYRWNSAMDLHEAALSNLIIPPPVIQTNDAESVLHYVRSGIGISILPTYALRGIADDPGIRTAFAGMDPENVYMLINKDESDKHVLNFVQFIRNWVTANRSKNDLADYI